MMKKLSAWRKSGVGRVVGVPTITTTTIELHTAARDQLAQSETDS